MVILKYIIVFLAILSVGCTPKVVKQVDYSRQLERIETRLIESDNIPADIIIIDSNFVEQVNIDYDSLIAIILENRHIIAEKDTIINTIVKYIEINENTGKIDTLYRKIATQANLMYDYNNKKFALKLIQEQDSVYSKVIKLQTETKSNNWILFILIGAVTVCLIIIILPKTTR